MTQRGSKISYRVPYADTDQMGVVYYANYLVYFERLRNQLLRDLGLPYRQLEDMGFALPVIEAHVEYREGARYDDVLVVSGLAVRGRGARLRVDCEVRRGETLLARGYTIHACVSLRTGRPVRLPPELAGRLADGKVV
ncbi:MAG: acyl-CoA thioesterase [Kiritimatiellaeota bacterium]|nr:acyl-CoA thioesterase [Kiritimatiellota bacterium]